MKDRMDGELRRVAQVRVERREEPGVVAEARLRPVYADGHGGLYVCGVERYSGPVELYEVELGLGSGVLYYYADRPVATYWETAREYHHRRRRLAASVAEDPEPREWTRAMEDAADAGDEWARGGSASA